jgi:hypothetical protein
MTPPPNGPYKINSVAFNTQYADLTNGSSVVGTQIMGHHEDGTASGISHRTVRVYD